jgi:hypothetical protein
VDKKYYFIIQFFERQNRNMLIPPPLEQEQIVSQARRVNGVCDGLEQSIKESQRL